MEGSSMREFPRMALDKPVELTIGEQQIKVENPSNNLSAGGLFVRRADLPNGTTVRVRIPVNSHFFEADGEIRNIASREAGAGIGFTKVSDPNRLALDELIEELTLRGLPAA
jgi:PilZ domain